MEGKDVTVLNHIFTSYDNHSEFHELLWWNLIALFITYLGRQVILWIIVVTDM